MTVDSGDGLSEFVNLGVLEARDGLAAKFAAATPFRHVVIDDFLEDNYCRRLMDEFPAFDEKLAVNEDGVVGAKAVREQIRSIGPAFAALDDLSRREAFRALIGHITGIEDLHHDPHYFGGGTHENLHGQGLDAHVDFNYHPITREHRRLNLIVYLNSEWRDEWGGSLQLHRDPYLPPSQDEIKVVTPLANRCVIFETNEYSWHGFPRIELPIAKRHLSRRSFALYYYTAIRPADETAAEHSTIYVEQHLPEWYQPDMKLDATELQRIRNLVASRDQHLKRLYGHIKLLNRQMQDLKGQLGSNRGVKEAPPLLTEDAAPDEQMALLMEQLRTARRRVRELESSTSWRLTAPLRAIKRTFRRR